MVYTHWHLPLQVYLQRPIYFSLPDVLKNPSDSIPAEVEKMERSRLIYGKTVSMWERHCALSAHLPPTLGAILNAAQLSLRKTVIVER